MAFLEHIEYGFNIATKEQHRPIVKQVHGNDIVKVSSPEHHNTLLQSPLCADAVFTEHPDVELYVFTADCVPLLFFSKDRKGPIAAVHCGWRGAQAGIGKKATQLLSSMTKDLQVIVGPCIRGCCYEVGRDLIDSFDNAQAIKPFLETRAGSTYFDLPRYVVQTQLSALDQTCIHVHTLRCTHCSSPKLPSYRRDKTTDIRIRSWIRKSSKQ